MLAILKHFVVIVLIFALIPLFYEYAYHLSQEIASRLSTPLHLDPCLASPSRTQSPSPESLSGLLKSALVRHFNSYRLTTSTFMIPQNSNNDMSDCIAVGRSLVECELQNMIPVTIREVTPENKHLIPGFRISGFEFIDLSETFIFQNNEVSLHEYDRMLERITSRLLKLPKGQTMTNVNNGEPILQAIAKEFALRHGMELNIFSVQIITPHTSFGTDSHTDGRTSPPTLKLWIPLETIDNFVLAVGDTNALSDRKCAGHLTYRSHRQCVASNDFAKTIWYHQSVMRPQDVIIFSPDQVPHFSANQGVAQKTQHRQALMVKLRFNAKHCEYY